MLKRKEYEKIEKSFLADFAMKSQDSKGRVYPEPEHDFRSSFQRDRDRIVHSAAFRKLEYKTQVFVNYEGDYYRTRLTHTLEVAQIARTIARALKLNEDLVEAIALAHDLGHTPFGHAGEEALRELMHRHGGFEHNRQGLRVVDYLERRYPDFKGLNLTWEVREGIIKHTTVYDHPEIKEFKRCKSATLEAQVVDIADEIAYDSHDLDDGITSQLIDLATLNEVKLWRQAQKQISLGHPHLDNEIKKYQIVKFLINLQVQDIIKRSKTNFSKNKIRSLAQVRKQQRMVKFSPGLAGKKVELRAFLNQHLYQHYKVIKMSHKAHRFVRELFQCYIAKPEQLPPGSQVRLKTDGVYRVVCDYIAGMTDRYAHNEYRRLFQPYEIM